MAWPHLSTSVFTHSDYVLRGLPFFLVPGIRKFVIDSKQDVACCTWPYHLSRWQQWTNVMSLMPSFSSSEAEGALSLSLVSHTQRITARSLRGIHHISSSSATHFLLPCSKAERTPASTPCFISLVRGGWWLGQARVS